jgi:UDP-N-acetylglucosamine--N-acetylmuramyl-(pentapeptide) pyrophosphoryl-undecaprenol N-acetylglucosamine transferase
MRICITGGGTGGHVTPLLAVACEIKKQDPTAVICYVGTKLDLKSNLVTDSKDIDVKHKILAGKLRRYHGKPVYWYLTQPKVLFFNIRDLFYTVIGFFQSLFVLLFNRPNVLFVKGGYVGLPVGFAAALLRIPVVTHDSDTYPGLTNRLLSKHATALAVGAPIDAYPQYKGKNLFYTGVPIRESFYRAPKSDEAKKLLGIPQAGRVVVILGGSLGAIRLNEAILYMAEPFLSLYDDVYFLWVTGDGHYQEIKDSVSDKSVSERIKLFNFCKEPELLLSAADFLITRAGATAIAEASLFAKPSIVVPNQLLTGGHQVKNALVLEKAHAAIVISDADIQNSPELLQEQLVSLLENPDKASSLGENLAKFSKKDAAKSIANLIINTAKHSKG